MASDGKRIHQRMSKTKHQQAKDRLWDLYEKSYSMTSDKRRKLMAKQRTIDVLNDKSMYDSAGGDRVIPKIRQWEANLNKERQPKGPSVDVDTAYERQLEREKRRR